MKMNRRTFTYAVGGVAAGIAGWVLVPRCSKPRPEQDPADSGFRPRLAEDVTYQEALRGAEIVRPDEQGEPRVVCQVNECGLKLLERMNGEQTLHNLAAGIHEGSDPATLGHTEASVALFVAMLAQAGLLSEPFFVNLHSVEINA